MREPEGRWVEVGDGVLVRRHAELDLTTGLVLGSDRALVIDTRGDERQGAELAAAVRAVTTLPVEVVLTHAHFDHCFGTTAFLPCPVHAHAACRTSIAATADAQRTEWAAYYREHGDPSTADALARTSPPLPDHAVDPVSALDLGGRTVELRHLGRGHTDHDVVVHVADAAVVFAGDLAEQGAPPDFGDAFPQEWPHTVTALLALRPRVVVPGHGEPMSVHDVAEQRDALAEIAGLYAAVAAGELDGAAAQARSPYPGVRWPG
ncbi:MBL fold metallo-hydrolase [Pseudonocardia sp. H11422]|uniref:MBL fold metallo-hydrolase n=1 Tax=Pseudonocardia sp. H11422 TaxID=2835866 RepID=UPI001BDDAC32|nr:MBL fold metallo-hydrolase [Pseudonocardia sp. H11422]